MSAYLSFTNVLLFPVMILFAAGVSVRTFVNLLLSVKLYAGSYSKNTALESLRPLLKKMDAVLDQMYGKISGEKITLTHLILMSCLIMLIGIYSAVADSNKRSRARAQDGDK